MAKIKYFTWQYQVKILGRVWCVWKSQPVLVQVATDRLVLKNFHFWLKWIHPYIPHDPEISLHGIHPIDMHTRVHQKIWQFLSDKFIFLHWQRNEHIDLQFPCIMQSVESKLEVLFALCFATCVFLCHYDVNGSWLIWQHQSRIKMSFSAQNGLWYLHIFHPVFISSEWWFPIHFLPNASMRIQ